MKIKYIDLPGVRYVTAKLDSPQEHLGFYSSYDNTLVFDWKVGDTSSCRITLEEAIEVFEGQCFSIVEKEEGSKNFLNISKAYVEIPDTEEPIFSDSVLFSNPPLVKFKDK